VFGGVRQIAAEIIAVFEENLLGCWSENAIARTTRVWIPGDTNLSPAPAGGATGGHLYCLERIDRGDGLNDHGLIIFDLIADWLAYTSLQDIKPEIPTQLRQFPVYPHEVVV
jgi:hypothetical protein